MWCRLVRRHGDRPDDRPPVIARASAAESGGHHAGWGYELSLRISAKSAATKSCLAVNRSTMRIGAPQPGHGHDRVMVADGAGGGGGATARTARHVAKSAGRQRGASSPK